VSTVDHLFALKSRFGKRRKIIDLDRFLDNYPAMVLSSPKATSETLAKNYVLTNRRVQPTDGLPWVSLAKASHASARKPVLHLSNLIKNLHATSI
jgi:hypothetical protein